MKLFNWLAKFLPESWKWGVASKKVVYTVSKLAAAGLMYGKVGQIVGSKLTPDQIVQVQTAAAAIVAGGLESLHDYLKLKYPENNWL